MKGTPHETRRARLENGDRPGDPTPAEVDVSLATNKKETAKTHSRIRKTGPAEITVQCTSLEEALAGLCTTTGTRHAEVAIRIANQVHTCLVLPRPEDPEGGLCQAISMIAEMAPQNVTEALLAAQMLATHEAALLFLKRATLGNQDLEVMKIHALWATRLMQVFNEQLAVMQKLKGKAGQQKVTVEHVHVYQGGQAIVGAVNAGREGPGEGEK